MTDYLQELKLKKYELDKSLLEAIQICISNFEVDCDLKVTDITVNIDTITRMGEKPEPILTGVSTDVGVLDHDNETQIIITG